MALQARTGSLCCITEFIGIYVVYTACSTGRCGVYNRLQVVVSVLIWIDAALTRKYQILIR